MRFRRWLWKTLVESQARFNEVLVEKGSEGFGGEYGEPARFNEVPKKVSENVGGKLGYVQ